MDQRQNENAHQGSLVIQVPSEDVGRLIGKNGVQINSLREQSQCSISVDTTNRSQPVVHLRGSPAAVAKARALIADICGGDGVAFLRDVDENVIAGLTRHGWMQAKAEEMGVRTELRGRNLKIMSSSQGDGRGGREAVADFKKLLEDRIAFESELMETTITCDNETLRRIREDQAIKQLEVTSHLKINISKVENGMLVTFKGQRAVVEEAMESLAAIQGSSSEECRDFLPVVAQLFDGCSDRKFEDLRADIAEGVEEQLGVKVELQAGSTKVNMYGQREDVAAARPVLQKILCWYFPERCCILPIPTSAIPTVCGQESQYLLRLQSVSLAVSLDRPSQTLWICGSSDSATKAERRLKAAIEQWQALNVEIPIHDSRHVGYIVGPRGETIRRIGQETGAIVSVEEVNGTQTVRIQGTTPEAAIAAEEQVQRILRNAAEGGGGRMGFRSPQGPYSQPQQRYY